MLNLFNIIGMAVDTENLMQALKMMGTGMGGIFVALFIIYLASIALMKIFPEKKDNKK